MARTKTAVAETSGSEEKKKTREDELGEAIAANLNKLSEDGTQIAFHGNEADETPADVTDWISTGSSLLDLAISNRPHGGIACGRITELQGLEGSGKSLVAAHAIADVLNRGGNAVLIDTENAVNWDFFKTVGVYKGRHGLVSVQMETVENIFEAVTNIIETVRSQSKDKLVLIVIDSLAGASTKVEMEADFDKDGYATGKAILISKALRKITQLIGREKIALVITNQLRQKLNVPQFADQWTTSGGKALAFHASTRIRFSLIQKIKNNDDVIVGVEIKAHILKSRLGPPYRTAQFEIYFDRGIDDYSSWITVMKDKELVTKKGGYYEWKDSKNKKHPFTARELPEFLKSNPELKEEIYQQICNAVIMAYQSIGVSIAEGTAKLEDAEGTDD